LAEFGSLGASIAGISNNDVATLLRYQSQAGCGLQFVSDPGKEVTRAYGAVMGVLGFTMAKRITFVISRAGRILRIVDDLKPLTNVNTVYRWLKDNPQA
jgi:peroxiredoxin